TGGEDGRGHVLGEPQLAGDFQPLRGERVQLQQVVLNLVITALEAMGAGRGEPGTLAISAAPADAGVLVTLRDSGPGLPAEGAERLFEAFYTTKSSGLGMGLSICRSIIEAHQGRLWATSSAQGAVFHFALPAYRESLD